MKKPIFTALSPNTECDDLWLAFKLLCTPWRLRYGKSVDMLRERFSTFLHKDPNHCFFFESGRTALYTLLQALSLEKGDEILIQAYTCVAVPEPVLWVGVKPVYVDIDPTTLTMSVSDLEKKITHKTKVLIIQHTFGQPAQITELIAIAQQHHLFVIEDCAHSLGGAYHEQQLGTFGDASFFSFGRDKVISSVFGGALFVKNKALVEKMKAFVETYPFPSRLWTFQQLLHPLITGFAKATYSIALGKLVLKLARILKILSKAVYPEERQGYKPPFIGTRLPNSLALLALHQLNKLETFNAHRRELALFYEKELSHLPFIFPTSVLKKGEASVFLRYTLQTPDAPVIRKKAKEVEIHLGDWYTTAIAPEDVNYEKILYNPAECPVAEKVSLHTFNLPTNIQVTLKDAKRITQFLKDFYAPHDSSR